MTIEVISTTAVNLSNGPAFDTPAQPEKEILQGIFKATTGNTWRNNQGKESKAETADVFKGALRVNGLPCAIVLDGCSSFAKNADIQGIADILLNMAEDIAKVIEEKEAFDEDIIPLVKRKYRDLDKKFELGEEHCGKFTSDASFSIVILYRGINKRLKSLSFGTGDTLIAIDDGESVSTVIAAKNVGQVESKGDEREIFPLSFPCQRYFPATLERTVENLEIDIREVKKNDRFIFLTDGVHEHLPTEKEISHQDVTYGRNNDKKATLRTIKTTLKSDAIQPGKSVKNLVDEANQSVETIFKAKKENSTLQIGDDVTAAELIVPSQKKREELKKYILRAALTFKRAIKEARKFIMNHNEDIQEKGLDVINAIQAIQKISPKHTPELITLLSETKTVIEEPTEANIKHYQKLANDIQIKSPAWKDLGIAMMALSVVLLPIPIIGISCFAIGLTLFSNNYQKDAEERRWLKESMLALAETPKDKGKEVDEGNGEEEKNQPKKLAGTSFGSSAT